MKEPSEKHKIEFLQAELDKWRNMAMKLLKEKFPHPDKYGSNYRQIYEIKKHWKKYGDKN